MQPGKLEGWEKEKQDYTEHRLQRKVKMLLSYFPSGHFKLIGDSLLGKCSK